MQCHPLDRMFPSTGYTTHCINDSKSIYMYEHTTMRGVDPTNHEICSSLSRSKIL